MALPKYFCWTRFGTEAGESVDSILERKEGERRANGGIFLWGIGNSIGPSVQELVRLTDTPEVLFSPISGKARDRDIAPPTVARWTAASTMDDEHYHLPKHSVVTSRFDLRAPKKCHYALVCYSDVPLKLEALTDSVDLSAIRTLLKANRVGSSQVTAVVKLGESSGPARSYRIAFRALLVAPYFVQLRNPVLHSE